MSSLIVDGNCIAGPCQGILFLNNYGFLLYWGMFGVAVILAILLGYFARKANYPQIISKKEEEVTHKKKQ